MGQCEGCGAALTRRHQKVYCSVACQQAVRRKRMTDVWLETGTGEPASQRNHYIRAYVRRDQDDRCAICGCDALWQGVELAFVLDHIDGNASNNRRENLRLVCPNCDSQLPTFKSRNRGQGRAWRKQRYADGKSY